MDVWLEVRVLNRSRFWLRSPFEIYWRLMSIGRFLRAFLFSRIVRAKSTIWVSRGRIRWLSKSLELTGLAQTIVGPMDFEGTYSRPRLAGVLNGRSMTATFEGEWRPQVYRLRDYPAIAAKISDCIRGNIFDPAVLNDIEWTSFFQILDKIAPDVKDDLQLWTAVRILTEPLSISHLGLTRPGGKPEGNRVERLTTETLGRETTLLRVVGFAARDASVWKEVISDVVAAGVQNLIIDLRSCVGGDYSSVRFLSYLLDTPSCIGYLVGRRYYETHGGEPNLAILRAASRFWCDNADRLKEILRDEGVVSGWVLPCDPKFTGRLFLLTGSATASAAEALIDYARENDLATVIGARTAGCLFSSEEFSVGGGWYFQMPVAAYLTQDGRKIDGVGVEPHILVGEEKALDVTLNYIAKADGRRR
jgi:Peptidase family S41